MIEVKTCEICNSELKEPVLNLGEHPLCDDLVPIDYNGEVNTYPIEILFCDKCLTAHQKYQVPKNTLFPQSYHYRSRFTLDVLNGMRDLVQNIESLIGNLSGKRILDVGCNDGSLLSIFREHGAAHTIGVEPTGAFQDIDEHHYAYNTYFSDEIARKIVQEHGEPDIITFTNVFAHIEDLQSLLQAVKLVSGSNTLLVIENHYLGEVIKRHQFDTFYHEHPRTYSSTSFRFIADTLGMEILSCTFPKRYGGNIRVIMGRSEDNNSGEVSPIFEEEKALSIEIRRMQENVERWKLAKTKQITQLIEKNGPLRAKAFPGRAAILVKLLGLTHSEIKEVYEKPGSMKIGHFLPGTKIPIVSDESFDLQDPTPVLNLAWHISTEIEAYMRSRGFSGEIVNVLSEADFK